MTGSNKSVRALFAALMTTLLAILMHVGAGGSTSPVGIVIVFVFALWAAMILAGHRLGYLGLGSLLSLGQILMHLSMGWFTSAPASSSASATGTAMGHQHMHHGTGALDLGQTGSTSQPLSHMAGDGSSAGLAMVFAHVAAVIVTAVVLKRGEDIILTILQLALGPIATACRPSPRPSEYWPSSRPDSSTANFSCRRPSPLPSSARTIDAVRPHSSELRTSPSADAPPTHTSLVTAAHCRRRTVPCTRSCPCGRPRRTTSERD